ncbi:MAG: hypothetical protein JXQ73_06970 [Phycisphaerae bacterium]|nr:hypothetical protein [Phycisphaerae bacterium]
MSASLRCFWLCPVVMIALSVPSPASGAVLYEETFEDDFAGSMPLSGPGRWDVVVQGAGCTNRVVASSPMATGQAVHMVDPSTTAGVLLVENDDIGSRDQLHASFRCYEASSATGRLTCVIGSFNGALRFAELSIGAGNVVAKQASGTADIDPAGQEYAAGTTVSIDVVVNSGAEAIDYTTSNGLNDSLPANRYDVYVNGSLIIDDADTVNYDGSISFFSFQSGDAATGVDLHLDNIKIETVGAGSPSADFSLIAVPSSQAAAPGSAITYNVSVTSEGGFADPVELSTSGLPTGVIVVLAPATATPPATSVATVTVPTDIAVGTHQFTILGSGGGQEHHVVVSFVVAQDAIAPSLEVLVPDGSEDPGLLGETFTISGTADDTGGAGLADVTIDTGQANDGTPDAWSFTVPLGLGQNMFNITARDGVDNLTVRQVNIRRGYLLGVSVTGTGTVEVTPNQPAYLDQAAVTLTATAGAAYTFGQWQNISPEHQNDNPLSLVLRQDTQITAVFEVNVAVSAQADHQDAYEYTSVSLSATTDPAVSDLSYQWSQTGGATTTLQNADTANPSFAVPALTSQAESLLTFEVTVRDGETLLGTHSVSVQAWMAGDADRDHRVTLVDFGRLKGSFNTCLGDPDYDPNADFNGDGCVDLVDFGLTKPNFNTSLPP